jgi:hypothetical protein
MTLDVYAQLEQRIQRDHGRGFDQMLARAKAQLPAQEHESRPSLAGAEVEAAASHVANAQPAGVWEP